MQLPKFKNEINWSSVVPISLAVIGFIAVIVFYVRDGIQKNATDISTLSREVQTYQAEHAELHKDARSTNSATFADQNARLTALEGLNLSYRIIRLEEQMVIFSNNLEKQNSNISSLITESRLTNQQVTQILEFLRGGGIPPRSTTP